MEKLLIFQHVPYEDLGNLKPLLQSAGIQIDSVNFSREPEAQPSLDGYDGLVVLGSPMAVYEAEKYPHLTMETKLIERAAEKNLPVLGICLGSQLVANALGARVYPSGIKEIGWYDLSTTAGAKADPLFRHVGLTEKVFQWHGDTFDLPNEAVHLASSSLCRNQAFRYRNNIYALQFHLEVDGAIIDSWLNAAENRREIAGLKCDFDPNAIRVETPRCLGRLGELCNQVFGEFIGLFGAGSKR